MGRAPASRARTGSAGCTKGQQKPALGAWASLREEGGAKWEMAEEGGEERGLSNTAEKRRGEKEGSERGGGGASVFVHCVKCDHVLELLRQLGSSPAPGFQLGTLRGDSGAADHLLLRLTLHVLRPWSSYK